MATTCPNTTSLTSASSSRCPIRFVYLFVRIGDKGKCCMRKVIGSLLYEGVLLFTCLFFYILVREYSEILYLCNKTILRGNGTSLSSFSRAYFKTFEFLCIMLFIGHYSSLEFENF